jgi:hypothetical protein
MKKAEPKIKTQHLFRLFGVSPSSYYYQQATKDRVNQEQDLIDMIKQIHEDSYSTYGRRRMQPEQIGRAHV